MGATEVRPSLASLRQRKLGTVDENAPTDAPVAAEAPAAAAPAANGTAAAPVAAAAAAAAADGKQPAPAAEPYAPIKRPPAKLTLHLDTILAALVAGWLVSAALLLAWLQPSAWTLAKFGLLGVAGALAFSFMYYKNSRSKVEINQVVGRPGGGGAGAQLRAPQVAGGEGGQHLAEGGEGGRGGGRGRVTVAPLRE
jgi:hypothetical protein